jgi:putative component of membrane protein insertase Oxa1/YidC/SpoIIIJ protein YidD
VKLALFLAAMVAALPALGMEPDLRLDEASGAVAFLLGPPGAERVDTKTVTELTQAGPGDEWNGSLASGVARSLFFVYRFFLSSQDSASCPFNPSCSHFSQAVMEEDGFFEGLLATFDRLSRDSPFATAYYPLDLDSGLLRDPPEQYCLGCKR